MLVIYFKETPSINSLSSLPRIKRVYIFGEGVGALKREFMYCKFLESIKDDTGETTYEEFVWEIESLKKNLYRFYISKNVEDVTRKFNLLANDEYYEKYPEFTNMFYVLVSGYNYN